LGGEEFGRAEQARNEDQRSHREKKRGVKEGRWLPRDTNWIGR
jgi:hypothetical protein